jgi:hypothetical protein
MDRKIYSKLYHLEPPLIDLVVLQRWQDGKFLEYSVKA